MKNSQTNIPEPHLNKREQNRLLHFEDCASAIDQLFQQALNDNGADAFNEFWDFTLQFNHLSIYNTMLVRVQRRGATAVGTRRQWREIGRTVQADAVPLVILKAFGPVEFVYELGDTEGEPVPAEKMNSLFAKGVVLDKLWKNTVKAAEKYDIIVENTQTQGMALAGTATRLTDHPEPVTGEKRCRYRVRLNVNHDLPTRFAALAHELGHIYCGHVGADHEGRWPDRSQLTSETCELEAEAVAWLVCQRNGITIRSKQYLNILIDHARLQDVSMYAIFEAANRVEARTPPKKK